jgi:hypothetical protein
MPRRVPACLLLALSLWLGACQQWPYRARAMRDCPGALASTESLSGDFLLQQSVRVHAGDSSWSLRLISQLNDGELRLVGLDPLGVELFTLIQRGREVEVDALPPPLLEIPPENLLRDLHRIRFLRVADSISDGEGRTHLGDREIVEIWQAGRISRRSFSRASGDPAREAELVFTVVDGAERASVENFTCHYRSEFTTLDDQELR